MSDSTPASAAQIQHAASVIIDKFELGLKANYCYLIAIVLILYDILLTFDREVNRVWRRKFTGATILYTIVRYGRVLGFVMWSAYLYTWIQESDVLPNLLCNIAWRADTLLSLVINSSMALLLAFRMAAIYQANLWILFIVFIFQLGPVLVSFIALFLVDVIAVPPPFTGCQVLLQNGQFHDPTFFYGVQVAFAIFADLFILAMTIVKTLDIRSHLRHIGNARSYLTLLLRDGTFYYLLFLALDCGLAIEAVTQFTPITIVIQAARSSLLCRLILNLNEVYAIRDQPEGHEDPVSFQVFAARHVLGTMGAPLIIGVDEEEDSLEFDIVQRVSRADRRSEISSRDEKSSPIAGKTMPKTIDQAEKGSAWYDDEEEDDTVIAYYPRGNL